ncbi:MAG TPA: hypothetical protein VEL76_28995 [Gemmataceae bacterium]|nr:hypothetical protein [Gemmataceae bacterium]
MNDPLEDEERFLQRGGPAPTGRVYHHSRCGGETRVSGGDYTHICDPFWPCTGTFCCGCSNFVPLHEVIWLDTEEVISDYRRRMRAETPGFLKAWRFGVGFLVGGAVGALLGLLIALIAQARAGRMVGFVAVGGLLGAVLCYVIGTIILNRAMGVDYRRMR